MLPIWDVFLLSFFRCRCCCRLLVTEPSFQVLHTFLQSRVLSDDSRGIAGSIVSAFLSRTVSSFDDLLHALFPGDPLFFAPWESEVCNNRSVVTSRGCHVICLRTRTLHSASLVNAHMFQWLLIPRRRSESCLFVRPASERCTERNSFLD